MSMPKSLRKSFGIQGNGMDGCLYEVVVVRDLFTDRYMGSVNAKQKIRCVRSLVRSYVKIGCRRERNC